LSHQEMVGGRGTCCGAVLSIAVRRRSRDAALVFYDRGGADRRDCRPSRRDLSHPRGIGDDRAFDRAGSGSASELSDVGRSKTQSRRFAINLIVLLVFLAPAVI